MTKWVQGGTNARKTGRALAIRNSDRVLNLQLLMSNTNFFGLPQWLSSKKKKSLPMQETQKMHVRSPGQEDPPEKEMATHSSILAWKIPWAEEPGGLQSKRVAKSWTGANFFIIWSFPRSELHLLLPPTNPTKLHFSGLLGWRSHVYSLSKLFASQPLHMTVLPPPCLFPYLSDNIAAPGRMREAFRGPWHFAHTVSQLSAWSPGLCIFLS